jgi:hypothetical protein
MARTFALILALALAPDDKGDLLAAAKKTAEAKSYTFKGETKYTLPEGLDKSGGDTAKFEGKVDRDAGSWARTDAYEFVSAGGKTVARPLSEWRTVKDDVDDVQRLLYQALSGSRPFRAPHEDLAGWPRAVAAVKKGDGYEIELRPEAAREMIHALFPMGRWLDRIQLERPTASAKAWTGPDGRIAKLELSVKAGTTIQGAAVPLTATRTVTFSDYDATKVEIPEAAKKALEAK